MNAMSWLEPVYLVNWGFVHQYCRFCLGVDIYKAWMFASSFSGLRPLGCTCQHPPNSHVRLQGLRDDSVRRFCKQGHSTVSIQAGTTICNIGGALLGTPSLDLQWSSLNSIIPIKELPDYPFAQTDGGGAFSHPDWSQGQRQSCPWICLNLAYLWTQTLVHTDAFTHRRFYTQTLLHTKLLYTKLLPTEAFTDRSFYTQTLLHRRFYTDTFNKTFLHTGAFTHRSVTRKHFYTKKLSHTEAFTHRHFFTQELLHTIRFYTQKLLHTDAFIDRPVNVSQQSHRRCGKLAGMVRVGCTCQPSKKYMPSRRKISRVGPVRDTTCPLRALCNPDGRHAYVG